jgi:hypothetical protein
MSENTKLMGNGELIARWNLLDKLEQNNRFYANTVSIEKANMNHSRQLRRRYALKIGKFMKAEARKKEIAGRRKKVGQGTSA